MFRCLLRAHTLKEVTGLLHERTDVALHRLHDANPAGGDAGSRGGPTLPFCLSVQLPVAQLLRGGTRCP